MRPLSIILTVVVVLGVATISAVLFVRGNGAGVLSVEPETIQVRMLFGDTLGTGVVALKNNGATVAEILAIQPTCNCSVATPKTRTLKPSETTEMTVTVSGLPVGRHAKAVTVDYESRGVKSLIIPIEIRVDEPAPPWIAEAPAEVVISCRPKMQQGSAKYLIRTKEQSAQEPPFLTGVRSSDDRIHAEIESVEVVQILEDESVEREYQIVVRADVASLSGSGFAAMLSSTFRSELSVPAKDIPIHVRSVPPFRIVPPILNFAIDTDVNTTLEQSVLVLSQDLHQSWLVSKAIPLDDWLQVRLEPNAVNLLRVTCYVDPMALRRTMPDSESIRKEILIDVDTFKAEVRIPIEINVGKHNR